jgi:hypothetical protein
MQLTPATLTELVEDPNFDPFIVFSFLDGFPKPLTGHDSRVKNVLKGITEVFIDLEKFQLSSTAYQRQVLVAPASGTQLQKLFRQWLCREGVCDYGETTDKCFIDADYVGVLPDIIAAMQRYVEAL